MKKRIWALLLCLVLVCGSLIGCGDKGSKEDDKKESIAPEEYLESKFTDLANRVSGALASNAGAVSTSSSDGVGMDINLKLSVGAQIAQAYALEGLESIGLLLSYDGKQIMQALAELTLNDKSIAEAAAYVDQDAVYVNLPKYSKNFMKIAFEEMLGMSLEEYAAQLAGSTEGMPTAKEIEELWKKYSGKFIDAFEHESMTEDVVAGFGDYAFAATEYVSVAEAESIRMLIKELFADLKKYPALNVDDSGLDGEMGFEKFYFHYYEGKKGSYEWRLTDEAVSGIGFVSAEKGFSVYTVEGTEFEKLLYSVKESDTKGKIMLAADGEEYTLDYDNYTKDSVDISTVVEDVEVTASIEKKDDSFYMDFKINAYGIVVSGKVETDGGKLNISAAVSYQGISFGTLTLECKTRDFAAFTIPENCVNAQDWEAGLDQEAALQDVQQLLIDFPFLQNLGELME